jgi:sugar phosphate isomerase/epimerase
MTTMKLSRRGYLAALAAVAAQARGRLPANANVKWALSAGLWNYFKPGPFTDVLDVMKDTGFIGIRLTGYPGILTKYNLTARQMQAEVEKRDLRVATISFNGPLAEPDQRARVLESAREAMKFLAGFGANHLCVFTPGRTVLTEAAFSELAARLNQIGELAGTMGFTAGMHNHLHQMAENGAEIRRVMDATDPRLFGFSPDTAHLHLAGCNVPETLEAYKTRIRFLDYKDARWTYLEKDWVEENGTVLPKDSSTARFLTSIYDLGDGDVDFPACHKILKSVNFRGWICVDLDTAREGPRASFTRCGEYVVNKLEPIYK